MSKKSDADDIARIGLESIARRRATEPMVLHVFLTERQAKVDLPREARTPNDEVVIQSSKSWLERLRGVQIAQVYVHTPARLTDRELSDLRHALRGASLFWASSR